MVGLLTDEDDSIKYRIQHVSNGGKRKFYVNPSTGRISVLIQTILYLSCILVRYCRLRKSAKKIQLQLDNLKLRFTFQLF